MTCGQYFIAVEILYLDIPALLPGNQLLAIAISVPASATKSVFAKENLILDEPKSAQLDLIQNEDEKREENCEENYEKRLWNVDRSRRRVHRHSRYYCFVTSKDGDSKERNGQT